MECCSQHADEDQLALRSDLTTVHRVTTSCEDLSLFVLQLPDLKDAEAVQKFFLEEIQLGEELLAQGDYEKGVDHLTNAIAVCGQPQQQTLPPPVFQMLLTKLPSISQVGGHVSLSFIWTLRVLLSSTQKEHEKKCLASLFCSCSAS
uniref:mitochondrial import receptor subunit TOM20 homolog n=1 Tax=Gasterosteus aculeatus aculeatus TaxID=481459 RepID=UPI001A98350C|nr:mitochondrial import receptor subunit TOM20 homolog [Gasterosteus aculeatus aculeatus]